MKKILILLICVLGLSSCNEINIGRIDERTFIIESASSISGQRDMTRYKFCAWKNGSYNCTASFIDETGKYSVGDTLILVKK